jgi:hypothetical protein
LDTEACKLPSSCVQAVRELVFNLYDEILELHLATLEFNRCLSDANKLNKVRHLVQDLAWLNTSVLVIRIPHLSDEEAVKVTDLINFARQISNAEFQIR